jgi:capsule polysaccharide export protein KpsE/RkpR
LYAQLKLELGLLIEDQDKLEKERDALKEKVDLVNKDNSVLRQQRDYAQSSLDAFHHASFFVEDKEKLEKELVQVRSVLANYETLSEENRERIYVLKKELNDLRKESNHLYRNP